MPDRRAIRHMGRWVEAPCLIFDTETSTREQLSKGLTMRIAVISTYTHPTRLRIKEPSIMQSAVPELIAGLCPEGVEVEIFNEKEADIPLDRHWDIVFFSYLHSYYEHTKVL